MVTPQSLKLRVIQALDAKTDAGEKRSPPDTQQLVTQGQEVGLYGRLLQAAPVPQAFEQRDQTPPFVRREQARRPASDIEDTRGQGAQQPTISNGSPYIKT